MPKTVNRTLHYRNAAYLAPSALTLEEMLSNALAARNLAVQRERPMDDDNREVINTHARVGGAATVGRTLCGVLHRWVRGQHQLVFDRIENAAVWPVIESPPPEPPPPAPGTTTPAVPVKRDFLPHTLYFGVRGNHVVALQSQGLMAPELADYLSWFLAPPTQTQLAENNRIILMPASSVMLRQNGLDGAKAVRITKPLADTIPRPPPAGSNRTKPIMEKVIPRARAGAMRGFLRALGVNLPASLLADPEAKDLQVYLEIRRPHGRDPLGNDVMNAIGQLTAQHDSDDYVVELLDGTELKGTKLKVSKPVTVEIADGATHPAPMSVFRQVDEYLHELITSGKV
jgi:hypothetical protein